VLLNYNVAALYTLWDKHDLAYEALKKALEKDASKVRGWIAADPMFEGLRGESEFKALLALN
jgi:hypothetical protein